MSQQVLLYVHDSPTSLNDFLHVLTKLQEFYTPIKYRAMLHLLSTPTHPPAMRHRLRLARPPCYVAIRQFRSVALWFSRIGGARLVFIEAITGIFPCSRGSRDVPQQLHHRVAEGEDKVSDRLMYIAFI